MLYFLTSQNIPESQQKNGQESSPVFSKVNLIATTPKGLALLVLGVLAFSVLTFMIGFVLNKETAATELKQERTEAGAKAARLAPFSPPAVPMPDSPTLSADPNYAPSGNPFDAPDATPNKMHVTPPSATPVPPPPSN